MLENRLSRMRTKACPPFMERICYRTERIKRQKVAVSGQPDGLAHKAWFCFAPMSPESPTGQWIWDWCRPLNKTETRGANFSDVASRPYEVQLGRP